MKPTPGYYCVVQFCPDQSRLEAANVGVILFCPEHDYLDAKLSTDNARIQQFFGRKGFDWERINSYKLGIRERLSVEKDHLRSIQDLEVFAARRANSLRITPPRPITLRDPAKDLDELFEQVVSVRKRRPGGGGFKQFLREQFARAHLGRKLQTDLEVEVTGLNKRLEVPFGYQNGRFNLIQPVSFRSDDVDQLSRTASVHAVDGMALYQERSPELGEMQLVVVGNFKTEAKEATAQVERILNQGHVRLFTRMNLDRLIEDIRLNGREISNGSGPI